MTKLAREVLNSPIHRIGWVGVFLLLLLASAAYSQSAASPSPESAAPTTYTAGIDELAEIMVEAPEPRYVSPTRRDQIGRIWAPVMINGHGPFRLVLDTGASHSAVTALVPLALGIATDRSPPVLLRGVTGSATVPTIRVDTLTVGDLSVDSPTLPIIPDALGGAQGILGAEGLTNKRIFIDFRHDKIAITFSRNEKSSRDFVDIPFHSIRDALVVVNVTIGNVRTKAIIDTGGQTTIANLALLNALRRHNSSKGIPDQIVGATKDVQAGEMHAMPAIEFGSLRIEDSGVTFADMYIFKQWKLLEEPAILIGMDALGLLDTLVIDYRRHELQMRTSKAGQG